MLFPEGISRMWNANNPVQDLNSDHSVHFLTTVTIIMLHWPIYKHFSDLKKSFSKDFTIYILLYTYIYIYKEREREREKERGGEEGERHWLID